MTKPILFAFLLSGLATAAFAQNAPAQPTQATPPGAQQPDADAGLTVFRIGYLGRAVDGSG